jgi:uncharacterized protein YfaS (alpha-2-macroglobulin family)
MSSNCDHDAVRRRLRRLMSWLGAGVMIIAGMRVPSVLAQQKKHELDVELKVGIVVVYVEPFTKMKQHSLQISGRVTHQGKPAGGSVKIHCVIHKQQGDADDLTEEYPDDDGRFSYTFPSLYYYRGEPTDVEVTAEDDEMVGYAKYYFPGKGKETEESELSIDVSPESDSYKTYDRVIVKGSVTSNGQPVVGAVVKFVMQKPTGAQERLSAVTTDAWGYFTQNVRMLPEVYPSGGYTITASAEKEGYRPATKDANFSLVGNDLKLTLDATLEDYCKPWRVTYSGQATAGGSGVPGANIDLVVKHYDPKIRSVREDKIPSVKDLHEVLWSTDERGNFTEWWPLEVCDIEDIPYPYEIEATASKEGYVSAKATKTLKLEDVPRTSVVASTDKPVYRLGENITVSGRVTCNNSPQYGWEVRIQIFGPEGGLISELFARDTDQNGQFKKEGLRFGPGSSLGKYTIHVETHFNSYNVSRAMCLIPIEIQQ